MPVREPFGSVKPPMTNSWRAWHLSLSQSVERADVYRLSRRLAMT